MAGEPGFEPRQTESESVVLPLHHSPIPSSFNGLIGNPTATRQGSPASRCSAALFLPAAGRTWQAVEALFAGRPPAPRAVNFGRGPRLVRRMLAVARADVPSRYKSRAMSRAAAAAENLPNPRDAFDECLAVAARQPNLLLSGGHVMFRIQTGKAARHRIRPSIIRRRG